MAALKALDVEHVFLAQTTAEGEGAQRESFRQPCMQDNKTGI